MVTKSKARIKTELHLLPLRCRGAASACSRSYRRRVEFARVRREWAWIEDRTLQGGAIVCEARHSRFFLRAGWQGAAHPQRFLGRHYRTRPREELVGPLARCQRGRPHGEEERLAGAGRRPEKRRFAEPGRPRARERPTAKHGQVAYRRRGRARLLQVPAGEKVASETVLKVAIEHEPRPCERTKRGKRPYLAVLGGQKARSRRCFDPF